MMNTKRHDVHFLKAKKEEQTQNCSLIQDQRSFLLYCVFVFNDANVTKVSVFYKEGPKPNQFVRKV
jgi:hypothetical protein